MINKNIENLLNLPAIEELKEQEDPTTDNDSIMDRIQEQAVLDQMQSYAHDIDKIDQALVQVQGLDKSDGELDELSKLAKEKFEELMDLGQSVDSRFSGPILQTASTLLGHAIAAKQAKIDKKLRIVDLQLKKANLDLKLRQQTLKEQEKRTELDAGEADVIDGETRMMDRNALIDDILKQIGSKKE